MTDEVRVPAPTVEDPQLPPGQIILPPEPSVWKRYSSHLEFPLSLLASVTLHVAVGMTVLLLGALVFSWEGATPPTVPVDNVLLFEPDGGGPAGGGAGEHGVPLTPGQKDDDVDIVPSQPTPPLIVKDVNDLLDSLEKVPRPQDPAPRPDTTKPGSWGSKPGMPGAGTENGPGVGTGPGGKPPTGPRHPRMERAMRWTITIPYDEPEAFLAKLTEMQAVLFVREGDNLYRIFADLSKRPFATTVEDEAGIRKMAQRLQRIWYTTEDHQACINLAEALGLPKAPRSIFIFLPRDLEDEMFRQELSYRKLTEDEVVKKNLHTWFEVKRGSNGWLVRVTKQQALPPAK